MIIPENFSSCTVLGTGNNNILKLNRESEVAGLIYIRLRGASKSFKLAFSNTVDSTYDNGANAYANLRGESYCILSLEAFDGGEYFPCSYAEDGMTPEAPMPNLQDEPTAIKTAVTFGENPCRELLPGEIAVSDEFYCTVADGHYLALKIRARGSLIPYTSDKIAPCFELHCSEWIPGRKFPQPVFVGSFDGKIRKKKIAFLGDSITQGLGTRTDRYEFWVADIANTLPSESYAVWNLGLGFGRAEDAASDGVWLARAKENDLVNVCFGVNDILQYCDAERTCSALERIVDLLKAAGVKVGIFTTPPFDLTGRHADAYRTINRFIKESLSHKADYFFDAARILSKPEDSLASAYGGHPDNIGCRALADAFLSEIKL